MNASKDKIDELYDVLTHLWGAGEHDVFTVAIYRDRLKPILYSLFLGEDQAALIARAEKNAEKLLGGREPQERWRRLSDEIARGMMGYREEVAEGRPWGIAEDERGNRIILNRSGEVVLRTDDLAVAEFVVALVNGYGHLLLGEVRG